MIIKNILLLAIMSFLLTYNNVVFAEGNLASQITKLNLEIKGDLTFTPKEYTIETGKYYKWIVKSDGIEEFMIQAPDFFRNIWINQIVINDIEIHSVNQFYGIEFDNEGEVAIFFVPMRPGRFDYYIKGYEKKGMLGTFNVK